MANVPPAQARIEIWRGGVEQFHDISESVINRMIVRLPLLKSGIGGATIRLINEDDMYAGIAAFDIAKIFLWRQGDAEKRIFEGHIMKLGDEGDYSLNEFYTNLELEDYAQETIAPPSFINRLYKNVAGKTILTNTISTLSKCSSLTHVDPDNDIVSNHEIHFNNITPYNAITKTCPKLEAADGTLGFDAYTDPDGNIHVFKRHKYTYGGTLEQLKYLNETDVHPVRNRIPVYGAPEKTYPPNIDILCESIVSPYGVWNVAVEGAGGDFCAEEADLTRKYIGNRSIKFTATASCTYLIAIFEFYDTHTLDLTTEASQTILKCWIWFEDAFRGGTNLVELWDGTQTIHAYPSIALKDGWTILTLSVGLRHDAGWFYDDSANIGTFDWSNVKRIRFKFGFPFRYKPNPPYVGGIGSFWIDAFHFGKGRFVSVQESAGIYGVRTMRPIIDDNIGSDLECEKLSKFHLLRLQDAIYTSSPLRVMGINDITQGDSLGTERVVQIKHIVRYTSWETELTVSKI